MAAEWAARLRLQHQRLSLVLNRLHGETLPELEAAIKGRTRRSVREILRGVGEDSGMGAFFRMKGVESGQAARAEVRRILEG